MTDLRAVPAYILSLERRADRLDEAVVELVRAGFTDIRRVQAFDGGKWRACQDTEKIGCYMSHYAAWRQIADSKNEMAFVFEDDVVLKPDFQTHLAAAYKELPAGWQLWNLHSTMARTKPLGTYVVECVGIGWGSHAYLITKTGAETMMRHQITTADHLVFHYCRDVGIVPYGIDKERAIAFQRGQDSDIPQSAQMWFWRQQMESHCKPQAKQTMKIAVYALAKNEEKHAAAWAESCKDADYCVVTDTGSTDKTPDILRAAGVTVHTGNVMPWRWDDAHNLSLHHVPSDADVCVRLDLDERFAPGWREAIEKDWKPGTTKMRYWYTWSMTEDGKPLKRFPSDRVHSRAGYRWAGATHEGLVRWDGDEVFGWSDDLQILHHRTPGKKHSTDLALLRQAVKESPLDARMQWYYARQLDYENHETTKAEFEKYLNMAGGSVKERAYACRVLARRDPDKNVYWLERSVQECPTEPEGYYELARVAHAKKDHIGAFYWASKAVYCSPNSRSHTSDEEAYGHLPADVAAVNAFLLGLPKESLRYTQIAVERNPTDARLKDNLAQLQAQLDKPNTAAH